MNNISRQAQFYLLYITVNESSNALGNLFQIITSALK